MGGETRDLSLAELYEFSSGISKPSSEFGFGYPFVSFKDVFKNYFLEDPVTELVNSTAEEREACSIRAGDVLLTRTSENVEELGLSCVALRDIPDATFNGFTKRLRPTTRILDPVYAGYFFRSAMFRRQMYSLVNMSTRASLNNEMLARLTVRVRPLEEQIEIGQTLKRLDEKIALNRRMVETLEALVRALFKSWFVDFDPVRAKVNGRPTDLPDNVAALFPDCFDADKLPYGWRRVKLSDVIELAYGKALPAQNREEGAIPVYGSNGQVGWHNVALCSGPGIVVGRKGNPGTVTYVPTSFFCIDTTFYVVPKDAELPMAYIWLLLETLPLPALSADSAVPGLNRDAAYSADVALPTAGALKSFFEIAAKVLERAALARKQSARLASLRDALLPKLMSGELRVREAEKIAAA